MSFKIIKAAPILLGQPHFFYTLIAKLTIKGIVKIENKVEIETIATASSESLLNMAENKTVLAAVGALAAITMEVKRVPRSPQA